MVLRSALKGALSVIALFFLSTCLSGYSPAAFKHRMFFQDTAPVFEEQILQYINEYRLSKNLPALQMNTVICAEALKHSMEMAAGKTPFGHDGFDGRVVTIKQKLGSFRKVAENVAYGHLNAKEVVNVWLNSPGHRRNIEGIYTITGISTARRDDGTVFFTQIFVAM